MCKCVCLFCFLVNFRNYFLPLQSSCNRHRWMQQGTSRLWYKRKLLWYSWELQLHMQTWLPRKWLYLWRWAVVYQWDLSATSTVKNWKETIYSQVNMKTSVLLSSVLTSQACAVQMVGFMATLWLSCQSVQLSNPTGYCVIAMVNVSRWNLLPYAWKKS